MGFTHYPKLEENLLCQFCWYGEGDPRNTVEAIRPGERRGIWASAQNFTRFYGTAYCDQPLSIDFDFGNEDTVIASDPVLLRQSQPAAGRTKPILVVDGTLPSDIREFFPVDENGLRAVTDEDLPGLNYDGHALSVAYQPGPPPVGDKFLVTIYGRWLRVSVVNKGTHSIKSLRVHVRASVF